MGKKVPDNLKTAFCPFTSDLEVEVFIKGQHESRINPSNIEMADGVITKVGTIDKVYKSWILERDRRVISYVTYKGESLEEYYKLLTKEGLYLFEYIKRNCLREDKLYFNLEFKEFTEHSGINSRTSFWSAKKNLIDIGFIAETSNRSWYWINPKFAFRGVRHKCEELKDNIVIVTKKTNE
jgi:hypothetical protein